ncbi:hypothetical protein [Virgibacillus kimchii]
MDNQNALFFNIAVLLSIKADSAKESASFYGWIRLFLLYYEKVSRLIRKKINKMKGSISYE